MKRFLGYFATSILIVFCLHGLLFIIFLFPERRPRLSFSIRYNHAELIKEPKILINAGSNGLFKFSAEQISHQIGIPTVNLSKYASLVIPYKLLQCIPLVNEGDIILLPSEYYCYGDTKALNSDVVMEVKYTNPRWFLTNPYKALEGMFHIGLVDLAMENVMDILLWNRPSGSNSNLTKFGDMKDPPHPGNQTPAILAMLEEKLETSPQPHSFSKYAREVLTKFITECHQRKATVVLTYPGTFYYKSYQETAFQDFIVEIGDFARDLGVPVIGTPEDFLFSDKGLFWDSQYHLNHRGRAIATKRMIGLLKDFLKKHRNEAENTSRSLKNRKTELMSTSKKIY